MNERVKLYSASLYSVSKENRCEKEVYECLCDIRNIIAKADDYIKIISSAAIKGNERAALIEKAFFSAHPYVLNLMKLLAKKRLFDIFPSVSEEYEKIYFKHNGIERAVVTTAVVIDEKKKKSIKERLEEAMGKTVLPEFIVDEKIIGGIVVATENSTVDVSVAGALESIKKYISKI